VETGGEAAPQAEGSPNLLWGLGALGLIGAVTAAVLEERRKRKEEEARQLAEAQAKAAALNAAEEQKRIQNWMNGQIAFDNSLENLRLAGMNEKEIETLKEIAGQYGLGIALNMTNFLNTIALDSPYIDNGGSTYYFQDLTEWEQLFGLPIIRAAWEIYENRENYYVWGDSDLPNDEDERVEDPPQWENGSIVNEGGRWDNYIERLTLNGYLRRPVVCADIPYMAYYNAGYDIRLIYYDYFHNPDNTSNFPYADYAHRNAYGLKSIVDNYGDLNSFTGSEVPELGDIVISPGSQHSAIIIWAGSDPSSTLVLQASYSHKDLTIMTLEDWTNAMYGTFGENVDDPITFGHPNLVDGN
jgi:hypothetical protein